MPNFNQSGYPGLQKMQEISQGETYRRDTLFDMIKYLQLANPKLNKKDLLLYMLQRDTDQSIQDAQFGKAWRQNELEVQQRKQHGAPNNVPFTPGSLWM